LEKAMENVILRRGGVAAPKDFIVLPLQGLSAEILLSANDALLRMTMRF